MTKISYTGNLTLPEKSPAAETGPKSVGVDRHEQEAGRLVGQLVGK